MARAVIDFADLIEPVAPDRFFAEYFGRRPLHIKGRRDKFADAMSWPILNDALNLSGIWSAKSLALMLDGELVPAHRYCAPGVNRDGQQVLQALPERVAELVRQGASIVANEVDMVVPGLNGIARIVERELGAKVQSNLYCSWKERRAFHSHFDVHDVFALHIEGAKVWNVYEGRADHPINHPAFMSYGQAHHDRARGALMMSVPMEPGDMLYLPRGQYHDALASSEGTIHVTMSTTFPIGLDIVTLLFQHAVADTLFRQNLARDEAAFAAQVERIGARLAEISRSPEAMRSFLAFKRDFRHPRGDFALPARTPQERFRVSDGTRLVRRGHDYALKAAEATVPIRPEDAPLVGWIVERRTFGRDEFDAQFPGISEADRRRVIGALAAQGAVSPA